MFVLFFLGTHTLLNTWSNVLSRATADVLNQSDIITEAKTVFSPENKLKEKQKDKKLTERTKLFAQSRAEDRYSSPNRRTKNDNVELEEFNTPVYF